MAKKKFYSKTSNSLLGKEQGVEIADERFKADLCAKIHPHFLVANRILTHKNSTDTRLEEKSATALREIVDAGEQAARFYHDTQHFLAIASSNEITDWLSAVRYRAGLNHDVVYHHVDLKGNDGVGFTPAIHNKLEKYIEDGHPLKVKDDLNLSEDKLFKAAVLLFGYNEDERLKGNLKLNPLDRQNEFLSALYAIEQGRALGIPDKYILAEIVHIRATVPFGPPDIFSEINKNLRIINDDLSTRDTLTNYDINRIMHSAVDMANTDVVDFKRDFGRDFLANGYRLYYENAPEAYSNFNVPSGFLQTIAKQEWFLSNIVMAGSQKGTNSVFHAFDSAPSATVAKEWEEKACQNIKALKVFTQANASAVMLLTSLYVAQGGDARRELENYRDNPLPSQHPAELSDSGMIVYNYLKHQNDGRGSLVTEPTALYLLERLGSDGVEKLYNLVNQTGIDPIEIGKESKPGIRTHKTASAFLSNAAKIFKEHGIEFEKVKKDLHCLLPPKNLPNISDRETPKAPTSAMFSSEKKYRKLIEQATKRNPKKDIVDEALGLTPKKPIPGTTISESDLPQPMTAIDIHTRSMRPN
ncbi:MAG: hypothetical protein U1E36_03550 [Rickettsiales bacterium]